MQVGFFVKWLALFTGVSEAVPGRWQQRRQTGASSDLCTCPVGGPTTTTIIPITTVTSTVTSQDGTVTSTGTTITSLSTSYVVTTVTFDTDTTTITYPGVTETTSVTSVFTSTLLVYHTETTCPGGATRKVKRQTDSTASPPATVTTTLTANSTPATCTCTYVPPVNPLTSSSSCSCLATVTASSTSTVVVTETTTTPTVTIITPGQTTTTVVTSYETFSDLATTSTTGSSLTITSSFISTFYVASTSTTTVVSCTSASAAPIATMQYDCNSTAYLIGTPNGTPMLYNIDLATSNYFVVNNNVGLGAYSEINALGYNSRDDFLYGWGYVSDTNSALLRISAEGVSQELGRFATNFLPSAGDVDVNGQFWVVSNGGTSWYHIDLLPNSPTYGQLIGSGTTTLNGYAVYDMVYIPGQGNVMFSFATSTTANPYFAILQFSLDTQVWSTYRDDINSPATDVTIANWASQNTTIWGLTASSGAVNRQALSDTAPVFIGTAPGNLDYADGARCALNV